MPDRKMSSLPLADLIVTFLTELSACQAGVFTCARREPAGLFLAGDCQCGRRDFARAGWPVILDRRVPAWFGLGHSVRFSHPGAAQARSDDER